jgi:hypothetical protein
VFGCHNDPLKKSLESYCEKVVYLRGNSSFGLRAGIPKNIYFAALN